jgi:hypothetical protein
MLPPLQPTQEARPGAPLGRTRVAGDFSAAKTVDTNTMSLQYLGALKALGAGPATKFVFPMGFTRLLQPFVDGCVHLAAEGAVAART